MLNYASICCAGILFGMTLHISTTRKNTIYDILEGACPIAPLFFCKVEYLAEFFSFMWIITVKKCTKGDKNLIVCGNSNRVHLSVLKIIDFIIENWPFIFL